MQASWDSSDAQTYDADGWKKESADLYYVTITETEEEDLEGNITYSYSCDQTAEEIYSKAIVSNKNPIFVVIDSSNRKKTFLQQMSRNIGTTTYWFYVYYFETETQYLDSYIRYQIRVRYNQSDSSQNSVYISKGTFEKAINIVDYSELLATPTSKRSIYIHDGEYYPNAIQDVDGNWYGAVIIGNQVWLGENLKTTKYADGTPITRGYYTSSDSNPLYYVLDSDVGKNGYRYNWPAIVGNSSSSTAIPSGVKGIAPDRCHIPSSEEWEQLKQYLGINKPKFGFYNSKVLCSQLANYGSTYHTDSPYHNPEQNNTSCFTAIPTGWGYPPSGNTSMNYAGLACCFATCTEGESNTMLTFSQNSLDGPDYMEYSFALREKSKDTGVAVRCIIDQTPLQFRAWYVEKYGSMQHHFDTGDANVQPDWNQTDTTADDYIKNKPNVPVIRTMNHEQLTDSSLGDINIHDGFYFPNATQDADGNWYGAVVIGDQVWMGENLRTTRFSDGTPITNGSPSANNGALNYSVTEPRYYVSDDDPDTIPVIGLEYNGKALLNGDTTSNTVPSGIQGIAPNGWHIPSMGEYDQLLNYVVSQKRYLSAAPYDQQSPASHYYKTNALNERLLFGSVYAGGDADKYNATGFNWQIITSNNVVIGHVLGTTNTHSFNSSEGWNEEQISGCDNVNGTTIEVDNGYSFSDGTNTQYGIHVRCVSDLTPIQFRNWYIETYGSMQHHLLPTYTYYSHTCTNASEPLIMSCPDNEITHHDIGIDPNLSVAPSITINLCNTNDNCFTFMQGFAPSYYPVTLQYKGTAINHVVNFGGNSTGIFKDTNDDLYLYTKGRSIVFKLRVVMASTPYVLIESGEIDSTILNSNS